MRLLKYILLCLFAITTYCANAAEVDYDQKYQSLDKNNIILIRFENGKPKLLTINNFKNDTFLLDDFRVMDEQSCRIYNKANWVCKNLDNFLQPNEKGDFTPYVMFNGRLVSPPNFKLVDSK